MGIMMEPVSCQDDDAEVSSSMEDDLMSDQGQDDLKPMHAEQYRGLLSKQDKEDFELMPMDQYLKLQFRLFTKNCTQNRGKMVLIALGCMACVMLLAVTLQQSMKPFSNLMVPGEVSKPELQAPPHRTMPSNPLKPTITPAPSKREPLPCNYKETGSCPTRSLFQSPDIHRIATETLMRMNSRLLTQADYEIVQEFSWIGFKNIYAELKVRAPVVAEELERTMLNEVQKHAVMDLLTLLSDPSVQSLGFDVALIIRKSKFTTKRFLKYHIEDSLNPISEIQKVAHDILPKSVLALWGQRGHDWEMTLERQNIESMRKGQMRPPANISRVDFETKSLSIYAGVLHFGRVLLDIMKIHIRSMGPSWSTASHDTIGHLMTGIAVPTDSHRRTFMEVFLWPLKLGAQGLDVLRASVSQEFGHER